MFTIVNKVTRSKLPFKTKQKYVLLPNRPIYKLLRYTSEFRKRELGDFCNKVSEDNKDGETREEKEKSQDVNVTIQKKNKLDEP